MPIRQAVRRFLDLPLRRKLILSFLIVIVLGGVLSLIIGTRIEHQTIISLAEAKVRHDLASAWMVYEERLHSLRDTVRLSATQEFLRAALRQADLEKVAARLDGIRREFGLDVLNLTDALGRVVVRSRRADAPVGDNVARNPFVALALRKEVSAGTRIVPLEELLKEGADLAHRARFQFVPTPMAAARPEDHEDKGMMLTAAAPVVDESGVLLGVLTGGLLFNRNYDLVDRVKEIVFKGEKYKGHDIGTATLFQDDLRIATNVLDDQGNRAVGTRVSREVKEAVLDRGEAYVGRAFVVTAWYITAYRPIKDIAGRTIGMLYVGMLERPYVDLRNRVMATFSGIAALCALFLLGLLAVVARRITRPLAVMVDATGKIAQGDLRHRVDLEGRDEIGQLARAFNRMTDELSLAHEDLTQWGRTLERRVEERTRELRETQGQLVVSEKLASLGKMAAGVAHEINNPLTTILINTHLLLERPGRDAEEGETLNLIADETTRCAAIVRGLLDFARQTPSQVAPTDINDIIDRTLLLEKQASVRNIRIEKALDRTLPPIEVDKNKIQQVFSNLAINACEAMPTGGTLVVASRMSRDGTHIEITFTDTGVGISKENIPRLFDPFFTTKNFGTGLGLAVSYGIIRQRGGTILVRSDVGKGTVFTVRIPLADPGEEKRIEEAPQ
ncbi:MAG: cache domain-containing protein [Candidatus Aminicenantes bacterium]|nr:cache domain-containing protein [Candidatus Aminicenantes bacterium]